jgi:membrane associated rhomboid family serine protease
MVPLRDENPVQITPYITYILIILNVLVFIYEISLNSDQLEQFFQLFAVVPQQLTASFRGIPVGQPIPEKVTLIGQSLGLFRK